MIEEFSDIINYNSNKTQKLFINRTTTDFNNLEICCQGQHFELLFPLYMLPFLDFSFRFLSMFN